MGRVRCVRWKRSKQKREISSLFVFLSLSRLLYWQMTACQRGMWCEGMNGWTWERNGREGRMTSAQNWFPANPLTAPLASVSAFPHLSLVATAAAPSRLLEALFRLDSNVRCCACVSVFIWDARGCSPAQVDTSSFVLLPPALLLLFLTFSVFLPTLPFFVSASISPSVNSPAHSHSPFIHFFPAVCPLQSIHIR